MTNANFADVLNHRADASAEEKFGSKGGVLDSLKEGMSRLAGALPAAGTDLVGRLGRKKLNTTVTRFSGDAFVYLAKRGTPQSPGPIVKIVLDALRKADKAKTTADNKLVVIAHSFGGEIVRRSHGQQTPARRRQKQRGSMRTSARLSPWLSFGERTVCLRALRMPTKPRQQA